MKTFILALALSLSSFSWAATFIPLSFEKQLLSASAVVEGRFVSSSTVRTSDEQVMTQATFEVKRAVGFSPGEMANKKLVSVLYPGGTWQGITYSIPGAPRFQANEEVFLILNKTKFGYTLSNFSLGKYEVRHEGGEKYLVSSVFPQHPQLGNIPFAFVEKKVHDVFRLGLDESALSDRKVVVNSEATISGGRLPASVSPAREDAKDTRRHSGIWLTLLFAALGACTIWLARKTS